MARERKPLIEPGSVLPATDTLSRILERDRTASGRKAPAPIPGTKGEQPVPEINAQPAAAEPAGPAARTGTLSDTGADNITSNITAHTRIQAEISEDVQPDARKTSLPDARAGTKAGTKSDSKKSSKLDAEEAAKRHAQRMSASRAIPITLRLPEELNDWLDEYAHSHRKQGVKKQDLIARAVQLLVVELSADGAEGDGDAA